jgi:methylenetetrahydrofolate dehydrogenase (NADP+) / methenyltetrahydrofolate cyclohydrolase
MTYIFDGYQFAQNKQQDLENRAKRLTQRMGQKPVIASIMFEQDKGSLLYTNLKRDTAQKVGVGYQVYPFSFSTDLGTILNQIKKLNQDSQITGIIVQKPWTKTWLNYQNQVGGREEVTKKDFNAWWQKLVNQIEPEKDVDGLHPSTLDLIKRNQWQEQGRVLPATARAVQQILQFWTEHDPNKKFKLSAQRVLIVNRSNLLGKPLFHLFQNKNINVEMIGKKGFKQKIEQEKKLKEFGVIITATGRKKLITGEMVKDGVVAIDAGEPNPDFDQNQIKQKAVFLTPVPGGVGPVTVVSLIDNCLALAKNML